MALLHGISVISRCSTVIHSSPWQDLADVEKVIVVSHVQNEPNVRGKVRELQRTLQRERT